jgi:hypothetical protein
MAISRVGASRKAGAVQRVGDYRIVYGVEDRLVVVVVLKVGNGAEIYQRIRESDLDFLRRLIGK